MVLVIDQKQIVLDSEEVQDLVDDLGVLSIEIDELLAGDRTQAKIQALMQRMNLLTDIYS